MTGLLHIPEPVTRADPDGLLAEAKMSAQWSDLPSSLKAEQHGAVAVLKLARAQKRNALDDPTVLGIEAFFSACPTISAPSSLPARASTFPPASI